MFSFRSSAFTTLFLFFLTGLGFSQITPDELHNIGTAPSADRIQKDIQTLVNFGTRHTLSDTVSNTRGIGAARRWIKAEFEKISADCGGCLEVFYVGDYVTGNRIPEPTNVVSVVAIQRGTADPNRFVMMSGDIVKFIRGYL